MDKQQGLAGSLRGAVAVGILKSYRAMLLFLADQAENASMSAFETYGDEDPIMVVYAEISKANLVARESLNGCMRAADERMFADIHEAAEYVSDLTSSFTTSKKMQDFAKKISTTANQQIRTVADGAAEIAYRSGITRSAGVSRVSNKHHVRSRHVGSTKHPNSIFKYWQTCARRLAFKIRYTWGFSM